MNLKLRIQKIRESCKFLSLLILGVILIGLFIYYRIIYKRLPKSLDFIECKGNEIFYNIPIILFTIFFTLLCIIIIYTHQRVLRKKPFEIKDNIFTRLGSKLYKIITSSLYTVHCFLIHYLLPDSFDKIGDYIMRFWKSPFARMKFLIPFEFTLRIIICISFLIDIFIFFKLNFFYKSLNLITLILLLRLWFFYIKDWASNLSLARSYLVINTQNLNTPEETHDFEFAPEYKNLGLSLQYHVDIYRNLLTIEEYYNIYEDTKSHYQLRFNLIYYTFFLLGCLYILVVNINFYFVYI